MTTVGIIQARMGSSRLPGKMMLPLDGAHTITRVVERARAAESLDEVVVATSEHSADDVLERYGRRAGAIIYRGDEEDVLGRMFEAASERDADTVVRLTGDCPLLSPPVVDAVVGRLHSNSVEYAATVIERTFPRGTGAEAFTYDSFEQVEAIASEEYEREHVTPVYREQLERFDRASVTSDDVYDDSRLRDRTDLRLTLDEADDYELLRTVYEGVPFDDHLSIEDAVAYIDDLGLASINASVQQRTLDQESE